MRKWIIGLLLSACVPVFLLFLLMFAFSGSSGTGGGITMIASPLLGLVDEELAERYQELCMPFPVAWDMVVLADGMDAYNQKKSLKKMKKYNPVLTALEFCYIEETKYVVREVEEGSEEASLYEPVTGGQPETVGTTDTGENPVETGLELLAYREPEILDPAGPSPSGGTPEPEDPMNPEETLPPEEPEETPAPEEPEMIKIWYPADTCLYAGKEEILDYIGAKEKDAVCRDAAGLREKISQTASKKSSGDTKYDVRLLTVEESAYREILMRLFEEKDADCVLEVWESGYLPELYGDGSEYLPPEETMQPEETMTPVSEPESTAEPAD